MMSIIIIVSGPTVTGMYSELLCDGWEDGGFFCWHGRAPTEPVNEMTVCAPELTAHKSDDSE